MTVLPCVAVRSGYSGPHPPVGPAHPAAGPAPRHHGPALPHRAARPGPTATAPRCEIGAAQADSGTRGGRRAVLTQLWQITVCSAIH